ncbi:MAG: hypothetical protein AB7I01_10625 [Gammaproteobacteria bacterium]
MRLAGVNATTRIGAALDASYGRHGGRDARAARPAEGATAHVRTPEFAARPSSSSSSPAALLGAMIDRMGGAAASRPKGSYVNLRV